VRVAPAEPFFSEIPHSPLRIPHSGPSPQVDGRCTAGACRPAFLRIATTRLSAKVSARFVLSAHLTPGTWHLTPAFTWHLTPGLRPYPTFSRIELSHSLACPHSGLARIRVSTPVG
jgi:hypothetical protein